MKLGEIKYDTPDGIYSIRKWTKSRPEGKLVYYKIALRKQQNGEQVLYFINSKGTCKDVYKRKKKFLGLIPRNWNKIK